MAQLNSQFKGLFKSSRYAFILFTVVLLLSSVLNASDAATTAKKKSIRIMTYNVENLFDTRHDPDKEDYTYLPIEQKQTKAHKNYCNTIHVPPWRNDCLYLDWSSEVLSQKMKNLGHAILTANNGKGPDILFMQEVENVNVLEQLQKQELSKAGYGKPILLEGEDARGIDVGVFSRFPMKGEPKLHPIPFRGADIKTRGILEVTFELPDGTPLTVFVVHFPSQGKPTPFRVQALNYLNSLKNQLPNDRLVIAGGDFNITTKEDQKENLLSRFVTRHWLISHQIGCRTCVGSYYYKSDNSWSFFDMLLLSKHFAPYNGGQGWKVDLKSVKLENTDPEQVKDPGVPNKFFPSNKRGVSDHWPISLEIYQD